GNVLDRRDAELAQERRRPDAGELQELRRGDGAGGEDDLARSECAPALAIHIEGDADRFATGKEDARGERIRDDAEIGASARRAEIAHGGAATAAAPRRRLEIARAFLRGAVEIVVARVSRPLGRGDEGIAQLVRLALVGDAERAAGAMEVVG